MKNEKEQHGKEANTEVLRKGTAYEDWQELSPQRPTFEDADHKVTSTGERYPGWDRKWPGPPPLNGSPDENKEPTPISGGEDGSEPKKRRHSTIDKYTGGRNYDVENSRVPDVGKKWTASAPTGDPTMYPTRLPQLPANLRPVQVGWKERYKHALTPDAQVADAATAPNTPQRKRLRKTESK
jgi:hypothetical protein